MTDHFLSQFIKPGDLVFDIGVREGQFTDQFLGLGANVVVVEPMPEFVRFLRQKYEGNFNVAVLDYAVTSRVGVAELHISRGDRCNPSLMPRFMAEQYGASKFDDAITVRTTTLNTLIDSFGVPAFCKIDTEGSEFDILRGLVTQIPALSFEWGAGYIDEARKCVDTIGRRLNYEFNYVVGHHTDWQLSDWVKARSFEIEYPLKNENGKHTWGNVYARAY